MRYRDALQYLYSLNMDYMAFSFQSLDISQVDAEDLYRLFSNDNLYVTNENQVF